MDEEMTQVIQEPEMVIIEEMAQVIEDAETQILEQDPLRLDETVEGDTESAVEIVEMDSAEGEGGLESLENCKVNEYLVPVDAGAEEDFTFANAEDYEEVTQYQFSTNQEGQIRIRDFTELCEVEVGHFENGEQEADAQGENVNLPFGCNLCDQKFKKKLFLNNHMEKRHGIKFVFTERGKKVKLVRMPEELTVGEKLDPCVEALMQQNGQNSSNILGVQSIEQKRRADEFPSAHEVDPHDLLQGKSEREFGAGILVKKIRTFASKVAEERKETPFVVYRPLRSKRLYLLSIQTLNETTQLLIPATQKDLDAANGINKESSFYFCHRHPLNPLHNSPVLMGRETIKKPCTKFSHVAVVALAEQTLTLDENEINKVQILIHPPPPAEPCSLMKFQHFARTIIQCRPKRLRCLSFPPKPTERPRSVDDVTKTRTKRKYTRRNQDKIKISKKAKSCKKRKRVETSDDESEFDGGLDTTSSDEEDSNPRLTRVDSPISESDRAFTPPRLCHPTEAEVLEPPKKKFTRRGRPRKSSSSGLSKHMKKMKLEVHDAESDDEENQENSDTFLTPPRPRLKAKRSVLRETKPQNDDGNDGDRESDDQEKSKPSPTSPPKKRGRGRPRKHPIQV